MTEKEKAIQAFRERKERNAEKPRVNNAALYAGEPMYYYCRLCGQEMVLPESHIEPAPRYCGQCRILIDTRWVDSI